MVHETKDGQTLDYFVEMEIGICSCPTGCTGAACRHQAAVAKHYQLVTVNIAPVHSKEARKLYAIIARGEENTQDIAFYGDLTECIPTANKQTDDKHTDDKQTDDKKTDDKQTEGKQINTYKESLYSIADDLTSRLMEGDHNLKSGVGKFIQQYNRMTKSHAPNPTQFWKVRQ